jgi:hypothetical protein
MLSAALLWLSGIVAYFSEPTKEDKPIDLNTDLGLMLHHIDFTSDGAKPVFFPASIRDGVMDCIL